jgi:uncharacterized protein (DUF1330 family)
MHMADEAARHVIVVGLEVTDDVSYAGYRARMTPLLERMGGRFGYDFVVSRVLKSEGSTGINRVFTMSFPSRTTREAFFADAEYRRARAELFENAVASTTIISEYDEA